MSFNVEAVVDELENANSKIEGLQYDLDEANAEIKELKEKLGIVENPTNYDLIMRNMNVKRMATLIMCRCVLNQYLQSNSFFKWEFEAAASKKSIDEKIAWLNQKAIKEDAAD